MSEVLPTRTEAYKASLKANLADRAQSFRKGFRLSELSGALGDLGTLLPIVLSLALTGQVNLSASLIFGGIWNIVTGLVFRMPMCVQPMKSIAAIALTAKMTQNEIMAAGMCVSAVIFALGLTRTIYLVEKYTPIAVVRGIQMGTAISFAKKAADLVNQNNSSWGGSDWVWNNNYEWSVLSFVIVFMFYYRSKKVPTAIFIFFMGLIIAFVKLYTNPPAGANYPKIGVYTLSVTVPTADDMRVGFMKAALGQIPLTALNSVIALASLARDLFPERKAGTPHIAMSVGVMNLIGCFFGSIPFCHGSGGMAAQYRFGSRTEVSIIILGLVKVFFGLFFGNSLDGLLSSYPTTILGVMLFVSGIELGSCARTVNDGIVDDQKRHANFIIVTVTAGLLVGFSNDGIGFMGGIICAACFWVGSKFGHSDVDIEQAEMSQGNTKEIEHHEQTSEDDSSLNTIERQNRAIAQNPDVKVQPTASA